MLPPQLEHVCEEAADALRLALAMAHASCPSLVEPRDKDEEKLQVRVPRHCY